MAKVFIKMWLKGQEEFMDLIRGQEGFIGGCVSGSSNRPWVTQIFFIDELTEGPLSLYKRVGWRTRELLETSWLKSHGVFVV